MSDPTETDSRQETAAIQVDRLLRWAAVAGLVIASSKFIGDIRWLGASPLNTGHGFGSVSQQALYYWEQLPGLFPAAIWFDSFHGFHSVMGLIHFLMPIILLIGCCGVLCRRGRWARLLLLLYAVLWLGTGLLGLAVSMYAASTAAFGDKVAWTRDEFIRMDYPNQPWVVFSTWVMQALFPLCLIYLLTRPEMKVLFQRGRDRHGFEPVMRERA